jgi:hypothetical protein
LWSAPRRRCPERREIDPATSALPMPAAPAATPVPRRLRNQK